MMKHSSLSVIRTHMRGRYLHNHNLRSRIVTRGLRRRRSWWRKGGMVSLMISGILLIIGVALGKAIRPWEARSIVWAWCIAPSDRRHVEIQGRGSPSDRR